MGDMYMPWHTCEGRDNLQESVLSFYEEGSGEQTAKLGTVWHLITPYICAFTNVLLSYILHYVVFGVPEINISMPELLAFSSSAMSVT